VPKDNCKILVLNKKKRIYFNKIRVHNKISSDFPEEHTHMYPKVIGLGLGRTGTNSTQIALEMLGFTPCSHGFTITPLLPFAKRITVSASFLFFFSLSSHHVCLAID
jgi:hypothetical protein